LCHVGTDGKGPDKSRAALVWIGDPRGRGRPLRTFFSSKTLMASGRCQVRQVSGKPNEPSLRHLATGVDQLV